MEDSKRSSRRPRSAQLKAQVLAQCAQPGASVAKVAQAHGLNANLVHKWRRVAGLGSTNTAPLEGNNDGSGAFVALALPAQAAPTGLPDIRIELRRGSTAVRINWPAQAAAECAAWLREWLR